MRISDWSSDVCSSDLIIGRSDGDRRRRGGWRHASRGFVNRRRVNRRVRRCRGTRSGQIRVRHVAWLQLGRRRVGGGEDRKRVGEGKGVSVRVDLGGCRTIKKKKNRKQHQKRTTTS